MSEEDDSLDPNTYSQFQSKNPGSAYRSLTVEQLLAENQDPSLKLIPTDRDNFFKLVQKEQEVRLNPKVQDLYPLLNWAGTVEDLVHQEIFKHFGYDDCTLNHELYYALTRKYYNDPELKPHIYFWRNNVMHGSKIPLNSVPPDMPLLDLTGKQTTLSEVIKGDQFCVVFAGSVTCAIQEYLAFAEKYKTECKCYFLYIKEAHFVERDADGKYVDGWPIGFYDWEYPQHKSQEERMKMARLFKDKFEIPDSFEILVDVFPENLFDETFGIWPDNTIVFKDGKFVMRGVINLDGSRNGQHTLDVEKLMESWKQ